MKWFSLFWASYLLMLSCIPCTHHQEPLAQTVQETLSQWAGHSHHDEDNDPEDEHHHVCSPFCQCTCNGGFTVHTPLFELQALTFFPIVPALGFQYQSTYTPSLYASIWQPPKVLFQG